LGNEVRQVHLHDNDGSRDSHLAPGRGIVDFSLLFAFLKARKSPPPIITLEPHREEDLEPCLAYLEAVWPW
jgi:sugar phosphate isomerase/epimerase